MPFCGKVHDDPFHKMDKKVGNQLNITVDSHQFPSSRTTRVLGVTLDPLLTFSQHITKEFLPSTYKATGHSMMNYALPIWTPSLSDSRWGDLQVKQNAALRTVTECHVMTSVPHLNHETRLMTVREHNELLSIQFLLRAFKEGRPDLWTTEQPPLPGSRQVSPTLLAKFGDRLLEQVNQETWTSRHTGRASPKSIKMPPTPHQSGKLHGMNPRSTRRRNCQEKQGARSPN